VHALLLLLTTTTTTRATKAKRYCIMHTNGLPDLMALHVSTSGRIGKAIAEAVGQQENHPWRSPLEGSDFGSARSSPRNTDPAPELPSWFHCHLPTRKACRCHLTPLALPSMVFHHSFVGILIMPPVILSLQHPPTLGNPPLNV
jgi:hypothetical protein